MKCITIVCAITVLLLSGSSFAVEQELRAADQVLENDTQRAAVDAELKKAGWGGPEMLWRHAPVYDLAAELRANPATLTEEYTRAARILKIMRINCEDSGPIPLDSDARLRVKPLEVIE